MRNSMPDNEKIDLNAEIKKRLGSEWTAYQRMMHALALDGPIGMLCLPAKIEKSLINAGCLRVYDMIDRDFSEIKALSERDIGIVTTSLNELLAML